MHTVDKQDIEQQTAALEITSDVNFINNNLFNKFSIITKTESGHMEESRHHVKNSTAVHTVLDKIYLFSC